MQSTAPHESPPRHAIATMLAIGDAEAPQVRAVLARLGITTLDRPFDDEAPRVIAATAPDLVVVVCDSTEPSADEMIELVARQNVPALLVVDVTGTPAGTIAALQSARTRR